MKKLFSLLLVLMLLFVVTFVPVEATGSVDEFTWSEFDQGYVTIVFDDGRDCTATLARIFAEKNIPLSCAIMGKSVVNSTSMIPLLMSIQNHGGEILSHTYSHSAFNENSTLEEIEKEFSMSYQALTNAGFVVNGIIEAGSGGAEKKVNYDLVQQAVQKYYKYSDCYGTSLQYKSVRTHMGGQSLAQLKAKISRAASKKEWLILFAHDFNEISQADLEALLDHINETEGVKGVTYKYMYENFGNYPTEQDFGKTYYTVTYVDKNNTVVEEKVATAGSYISSKPSNVPDGTIWSNTQVIVDGNITISAVEGTVSGVDTPPSTDTSTPSQNGDSTTTIGATPQKDKTETKKDDTTKQKNPNHLWIIIAAASVLIAILVTVLVVINNKKKKDLNKK